MKRFRFLVTTFGLLSMLAACSTVKSAAQATVTGLKAPAHVAAGTPFDVQLNLAWPAGDPTLPPGKAEPLQRRNILVTLSRDGHLVVARHALPSRGERLARVRLSAPEPGEYTISAAGHTQALEAVPDLSTTYGGMQSAAAVGLPDTLMQTLRAHDFAVREGLPEGVVPEILIGDPANISSSQWLPLWKAVASGSRLILLSAPPPSQATDWPWTIHLVPVRQCERDLVFPSGAPLLSQALPGNTPSALCPRTAYDLSGERQAVPVNLHGTRLPRNHQDNYLGEHAVFAFRYGQGFVAVSSIPVLRNAGDVYAQRYLMNLMKQVAQIPAGYPANGLAYVHQARLQAALRH